MKSIYIVMAILASVTIVTIVTMSAQQVYAPRDCPGCSEFKKLTTEFEKAVIAASDDPNTIQELVNEFSRKVLIYSHLHHPVKL